MSRAGVVASLMSAVPVAALAALAVVAGAPARAHAQTADGAGAGSEVELGEDPPSTTETGEEEDAPHIGVQATEPTKVAPKSRSGAYPISEVLRPLTLPDWASSELLFVSPFVIVAAKHHPRLATVAPGAAIPLDLFCAIPQALRSISGGNDIQLPDPLAVNMAKYHFAHGFHAATATLIDLAGGLVATGPGGEVSWSIATPWADPRERTGRLTRRRRFGHHNQIRGFSNRLRGERLMTVAMYTVLRVDRNGAVVVGLVRYNV